MSSLFVLIPMGLILLVVAVWAFFWAVNHGQFDDLDSPAHRILYDDDEAPPVSKNGGASKNADREEPKKS